MRLALTVVLPLIFTVSPLTMSAAEEEADRIAHLHLRKVGDIVTLDSLKIVPGHLKVPRQLPLLDGDIQGLVRGSEGERLSGSTIADPSHLRLEYVDEQGRLQTYVERRDTVQFTVRIPYTETARTVEFHRIDHTVDATASPQRSGRSLGVISLPSAESTHD